MRHLIFFLALLALTACNKEDLKSLEDSIKEDIKDLEDSIKEEFVEYAKPLEETTSKPSDPARVLPPNPAGCPDWKEDTLNQITESITLPAGCKYDRVRIVFENKSDMTLDCNGAELNGLSKKFRQAVGVPYTAESAPEDIGIRILSHESIPSQNITIKNCKLRNYLTGIAVLTIFTDENHANLKNNANADVIENYLRDNSLKKVRIENTSVEYSHRNGIFIGRYITGLVVDGSSVNYTSGAGLYLESGTQSNTIKNSTFLGNGHSLYDGGKRARRRILAKDTREGIAIDSSAMNTIQKNLFAENSGGGIFIYKNCYEHHTSASSLPRYQSADKNVITENQFKDQKTGVWIASRQSKDLKAFNCGTPRITTDDIYFGPKKETIHIYEDFAKHNTVKSNTFVNVKYGVIVEDDNNTIDNNTFSGKATSDIRIGTKYRTKKLSKPVTNTIVTNNKFNSDASKPVKLVYDPTNSTIKGNAPESVNNK